MPITDVDLESWARDASPDHLSLERVRALATLAGVSIRSRGPFGRHVRDHWPIVLGQSVVVRARQAVQTWDEGAGRRAGNPTREQRREATARRVAREAATVAAARARSRARYGG